MHPPPLRMLLTAAAILGAVLGGLLLGGRDDELRIIWPELGGDGALVLAPDGTSILIDGGSDAAAVAGWLGRELPFGRRRIDVVVLTRADATTLPGQLAALRRYAIGAALYPEGAVPTADLQAWLRLSAERNTAPRPMQRGTTHAAGMCSLTAPAAAGGRLALLLRCGETSAWFGQSIDTALERQLDATPSGPAALLVWPWLLSTDGPFARSTSPAALVFGEGKGEDVLSWNARRIGRAHLLHEKLHGRVELVVDGDVSIRTERNPPYSTDLHYRSAKGREGIYVLQRSFPECL